MADTKSARRDSGDLSALLLPELRKIANNLGIENAADLKKPDLVKAITDLQAANNATVQKDQVILHIKAVDSCSITLNVSAAQTKKLKAGMPVNIKAAETPAPFSGKISSIDGTKITVTSDQKPEDLKDGVKVEISLAA